MLNVRFRPVALADRELPAYLASEGKPLASRALRYVDENHPAMAVWANGRFTHRNVRPFGLYSSGCNDFALRWYEV